MLCATNVPFSTHRAVFQMNPAHIEVLDTEDGGEHAGLGIRLKIKDKFHDVEQNVEQE